MHLGLGEAASRQIPSGVIGKANGFASPCIHGAPWLDCRPWRIDFSRADAWLLASSGKATSMSFFFIENLRLRVDTISASIGSAKTLRKDACY